MHDEHLGISTWHESSFCYRNFEKGFNLAEEWKGVSAFVFSAADDKVAFYLNDGTGTFGDEQVLSEEVLGYYSLFAADLDGDGDYEVLFFSAPCASAVRFPMREEKNMPLIF